MPVESVRIMCPSLTCRKILAVPTSSRGKNVRCRNCGAIIRVPERSTSKPDAPAAKEAGQLPPSPGANPAKAA